MDKTSAIMGAAAMTNAQMYFVIGVPVFAVIMGVMIDNFMIGWQARGIEKRIVGLDKRIDGLEATAG